jgi:ATP-dependent Clp protease adaptor protein ClpS
MANTELEVIESVEETIKVHIPKMWKVILHNDDTTTFDFVIAVLIRVFHKSMDEARELTQMIHMTGAGVAGIYTKEIAEEKTYETLMFAKANGFPDMTASYEEM